MHNIFDIFKKNMKADLWRGRCVCVCERGGLPLC